MLLRQKHTIFLFLLRKVLVPLVWVLSSLLVSGAALRVVPAILVLLEVVPVVVPEEGVLLVVLTEVLLLLVVALEEVLLLPMAVLKEVLLLLMAVLKEVPFLRMTVLQLGFLPLG